jgi:hypothetical protein
MDVVWGGAGFIVGVLFTKAIDMLWDYFKERRAEEKAAAREKKAVDIARKANDIARERAQQESGGRSPAILYLRECRLALRRETGVDYGAMNPGADPDETPATTGSGTTTAGN